MDELHQFLRRVQAGDLLCLSSKLVCTSWYEVVRTSHGTPPDTVDEVEDARDDLDTEEEEDSCHGMVLRALLSDASGNRGPGRLMALLWYGTSPRLMALTVLPACLLAVGESADTGTYSVPVQIELGQMERLDRTVRADVAERVRQVLDPLLLSDLTAIVLEHFPATSSAQNLVQANDLSCVFK